MPVVSLPSPPGPRWHSTWPLPCRWAVRPLPAGRGPRAGPRSRSIAVGEHIRQFDPEPAESRNVRAEPHTPAWLVVVGDLDAVGGTWRSCRDLPPEGEADDAIAAMSIDG